MITRKAFSRLCCPPGRTAANSASHRYADRDEVIGNGSDPGRPATPRSSSACPAANRCAGCGLQRGQPGFVVGRAEMLNRT